MLLPVVVLIGMVCSYPNNGPFPASFDCPMRNLAVSFAQHIQPFLKQKQLKDIVDALSGSPENQNCSISLPHVSNLNKYNKIHDDKNDSIDNSAVIYVDVNYGLDSFSKQEHGSKKYPFRTVQFAINYFKTKYGPKSKRINKKIYLRKGKYYLRDTINLNENDSNLIITNYQNEISEISGSVPLTNLKWT
eukprot:194284_1